MKKRFGVIATIVAAASFFSLITASVAWFEARTDVDFGTGHGSTAASYFYSGAGTSDSPFVIAEPIHMYNLAWLQYLGHFNTIVSPTRFKLKNNIDMSALGSALPPIGTEDNPFIGVFDGQGYTISNLTVSNDINQITKHPSTVQALKGVSVVGFFGIVGDPDPIDLEKTDGLNYGSDGLNVSVTAELTNFNLQNVVVKSNTEKTLMGIVAGYVNGKNSQGTINNIGVLNGSLQAKDGAQPIDHFADKGIISKFSLVGETEDTVWQQAYEHGGTGGDGQGDDTSFGGSINMWDINRRVTYILEKDFDSSTSNATYYRTKNSGTGTYGIYLQMNGTNTRLCVTSSGPVGDTAGNKPTNAGTVYLKSGVLPINVDTEKMFKGNDTISSRTTSGSTWTVATNNYYSTNSSETISANNTGYFTGDKAYGTEGSASVVFGSKKASDFSTSYSSGAQLKMRSIKPSETGFTDITGGNEGDTNANSAFGYSNFEKVREAILPTLDNALSRDYYNGFRLSQAASSPTAATSTNSFNAAVNINGANYNSYQLMSRGLNFTVAKPGVISLVVAPYEATSSSSAKSMFNLYEIIRNESHQITGITSINKVYSTTDGSIVFNDQPSGGTLRYNATSWSRTLTNGYLYYCEIPVKAGDYYIGGPSSSNSGYLIYLDIGANGNGSGGSGTTQEYNLKNVRYVHSLTETLPNSPTYLDILFEITTAAGATGTVAIYFARQTPALLYYHKTNNVDLRVFIATATNIEESTSAVWTS